MVEANMQESTEQELLEKLDAFLKEP